LDWRNPEWWRIEVNEFLNRKPGTGIGRTVERRRWWLAGRRFLAKAHCGQAQP
jgi:hypothetical protein